MASPEALFTLFGTSHSAVLGRHGGRFRRVPCSALLCRAVPCRGMGGSVDLELGSRVIWEGWGPDGALNPALTSHAFKRGSSNQCQYTKRDPFCVVPRCHQPLPLALPVLPTPRGPSLACHYPVQCGTSISRSALCHPVAPRAHRQPTQHP